MVEDGATCLRSSDCHCENCALSKPASSLVPGLGAMLQNAVAVGSEAERQVPQVCPDLVLDLGSRIDAQVSPDRIRVVCSVHAC